MVLDVVVCGSRMLCALSVLVVLCCVLVTSDAMPPVENVHNSRSFRNALNQQGIQTILQSIENRLRNLDQVYSMRYSKPDATVDQFNRKLEMLESKVARLESVIGVHLDKISENIESRNFKDDMAKDQIFRKIDSLYDRLNGRINYFEGKVDIDFLKMQSKIETTTSKLERMEHSVSIRQSDMETEITDGIVLMEKIKTNLETLEKKMTNATREIIEKTGKPGTDIFTQLAANITGKTESLLNASLENIGHNHNLGNNAMRKIDGIENKLNNYESKMTNMYNDIWKKSNGIETSLYRSNITIMEIKSSLNKMTMQSIQNGNKGSQSDANLEIFVESFSNLMQRKFLEMGRKFDTSFQTIMLAQNAFLDNCHRVQTDETQLEHKISIVLEKLLDAFTNRNSQTVHELQTVEEMLKEHDEHVFRGVHQNTNSILKLSEKSNEDHKRIDKALSMIKLEIGQILVTMQEIHNIEYTGHVQDFNIIRNSLKKFQQQIDDVAIKLKDENMKNTQLNIIEGLKSQMKFLIDENLTELNNTLNEKNTAFSILEQMVKNIFYNLNSIEMKLNKSYLDYYFNRINYQPSSHRFSPKVGSNIKHLDANDVMKTNESNYVLKKSNTNDVSHNVVLEIFPDLMNESNYNVTSENIRVRLDDKSDTNYLKRFNYTVLKVGDSQKAPADSVINNGQTNVSSSTEENTTKIIYTTPIVFNDLSHNYTSNPEENFNNSYVDSLEDTDSKIGSDEMYSFSEPSEIPDYVEYDDEKL